MNTNEILSLYWFKTRRDDGVYFVCATEGHPDIHQVFNHGNFRYVVDVGFEVQEFASLLEALTFSNKFIREDWQWRLYKNSRRCKGQRKQAM